MPYAIKKQKKAKRPFAIIRKSDGKKVGSSMSKKKALASVRARYAGESKMHEKMEGHMKGKHEKHMNEHE